MLLTLKATLLSIKKSVIYEPWSVYVNLGMVENPILVYNAFQASGFADCDTSNVVVPSGNEPVAYTPKS